MDIPKAPMKLTSYLYKNWAYIINRDTEESDCNGSKPQANGDRVVSKPVHINIRKDL